MLKAHAAAAARHAGTRVVFELPGDVEKRGYSTASKALLNADKLKKLGWSARYGIEDGIGESVDILRQRNDFCEYLRSAHPQHGL